MKCMHSLVFIVLNVRDGTESKYPSIVFLSVFPVWFHLVNFFVILWDLKFVSIHQIIFFQYLKLNLQKGN